MLILVPPLPFASMDNSVLLMGTSFSPILMDFTPMKYSDDGSPANDVAAVLTGFVSRGV